MTAAASTPTTSYRVSHGTQVLYLGAVHPAGDTFTADPADPDVARWVEAGWVEAVPEPRPARKAR